jgi:DNA polymerase-3 subunit gamma/tau
MPADETQLLYSICLHGRGELGLAPDEYAALTMVLLRLLAFKPQAGVPARAEKKSLNNAPVETSKVAAIPVAVAIRSELVPAAAVIASSEATAPPVLTTPAPQPRVMSPPVAHSDTTSNPIRVPPWEDEPGPPIAPVASVPNPATEHIQAKAVQSNPTEQTAVLPANLQDVNPGLESALPLGQRLHVVTPSTLSGQALVDEPSQSEETTEQDLTATDIVAIPVRIQADSRTEAMAGQMAVMRLDPTEEGDFWHATVQQLIAAEAINAMVRELALQSQLMARDTGQWMLRVERESLNQPGIRDRLTAALQAAGHPVQLVVEIGRISDCPARRNTAAAAERQLQAEKVIFDNTFVQSIMRDFGAKIVPGSIKPV